MSIGSSNLLKKINRNINLTSRKENVTMNEKVDFHIKLLTEGEDPNVETYWQDKSARWRSSDTVHWRWRKKVAKFLEKRAAEEKERNEGKLR